MFDESKEAELAGRGGETFAEAPVRVDDLEVSS